MLKDGKFFREAPLRIGAHYIPRVSTAKLTPEELFVQSLLLGIEDKKQSLTAKLLSLVLRA